MKSFIGLLVLSCIAFLANADDIIPVDEIIPSFPILPELHNPEGRIVGGDEAVPHSLPYQVGLALQIGSKTAWCGGSLISNQWVLTAAHCTEQAKGVVVYLGAHNIKDDKESTQIRIEVPKSNLLVHESWSRMTLLNDISLIKLPEPVQLNENIQIVNLPRRSQVNKNFEKETVLASGWGKDADSATAVSPVLRVVEVPVVKKLTCKLKYFGVIKDTHICAGSKGKSTCNGDSGGPLVLVEKNGSKTLLGATSFGIAFGCEKGWPGVFTRVTSYLDWISSKTGIEIRP